MAGATARREIELETSYELARWLAADLDHTVTPSALTHGDGMGLGLALVRKQTWSGGVCARHRRGPSRARAGLRSDTAQRRAPVTLCAGSCYG
ncbi:MAG TPA: hypothetical protein VF331_14040 [Polyangiales bacterium]